ncbi:hypothetical protein MMC07_002922 [Pseudocyphellaria aurata]|nr:hypothetical protein [Pseudocyphellaria aurata]
MVLPPLSSQHQDSLFVILREEEHLQLKLQALIDAQSEGLLSGVVGVASADGDDGDIPTTGSRTPTLASTSILPNGHGRYHTAGSRITTPIRQPAHGKIGLHGARRGITRAISELAVLKAEEGRLLEGELVEKSSELSTVQTLAQKSVGLEGQIRKIEDGEDMSRKISEMQQEEKVLNTEIKELEVRLWEMKSRHRQMVDEIQGLDNRVQSQLSSYKAALELAKKETKAYLMRPPARIMGKVGAKERSGIWGMPADRRTLDMVQEYFRDEQRALIERSTAVETERRALEEGVVVWKDVVREVGELEKVLKAEMHRLPPSPLQERDRNDDDDGGHGSLHNGSAEDGMRSVLRQMQWTKSRLESQLDLAEGRGWKLLVCCVGAELEAVTEGHEVLRSALNPNATSSLMDDDDDTGTAADAAWHHQQGENGLIASAAQGAEHDAEPDRAARSSNGDSIMADSGSGDIHGGDGDQRRNHLQGGVRLGHHQHDGNSRRRVPIKNSNNDDDDEDEDEDEGPGPDLLISHLED